MQTYAYDFGGSQLPDGSMRFGSGANRDDTNRFTFDRRLRRENRPVETGPAPAPAAARFAVREQRPLMVGKHVMKTAIGDASVCTINALMPEQHAGTGGVGFGRLGQRECAGGAFG